MKKLLLLLGLLVIGGMSGQAQQLTPRQKPLLTLKDSLRRADATLRNPFSPNLISPDAYQRMVFQDLITIGGLNIKQGQTMGVSLTVDDKGGAFTFSRAHEVRTEQGQGGNYPFSPADPKASAWALQGLAKVAATNGLVTLFSGSEYQKTLGAGLGGLFFLPVRAIYQEGTKKKLQAQYEKQRQRDSAAWKNLYEPQMPDKWCESSRAAISHYLAMWRLLQDKSWAKDYYNATFLGNNPPAYARDSANIQFMRKYWQAEGAVRMFLPAAWDSVSSSYQDADGEGKWLNRHFLNLTACSKKDPTKVAPTRIDSIWQQKVAAPMQRNTLKLADSLQKQVQWQRLRYHWFNVNALVNTEALAFLKPGATASDFVDKQRYYFGTIQLNYNWLVVGQQRNGYFTLGISADNRRQVDPTQLQTYQRISRQNTGIDSVRVVDQQQVYAKDPGQQLAPALQAGLTVYWHSKVQVGVSVNGNQKLYNSHQSQVTAGIFTPLKAGETTVMVMPQVRWDSQGVPNRWTVGISLSAAIPAYVTKKKK